MSRQLRKYNPGNAANIFVRVVLSEAGSLLDGLTDEQWNATLDHFDNRCAYTGEPLDDDNLDQDHAIPMNREHCGLHLFGNVIPSTKEANNAKAGLHYRDFVTVPERLERIEKFLEDSGYHKKIAVFGDLRRYCESQYAMIDALCRVSGQYLRSQLPDLPATTPALPSVPIPAGPPRLGDGDTLSITLYPSPARAFRDALMITKRAWLITHFVDGHREIKPWIAEEIRADSNIIANLRSRPQFRAGAWQAAGIARLEVTVQKPDGV